MEYWHQCCEHGSFVIHSILQRDHAYSTFPPTIVLKRKRFSWLPKAVQSGGWGTGERGIWLDSYPIPENISEHNYQHSLYRASPLPSLNQSHLIFVTVAWFVHRNPKFKSSTTIVKWPTGSPPTSWDSKPDYMTFIWFTSFRHLLGCISPCAVNTAEATCVNNEFFKSSFHLFSIWLK